MVGGFWPPPCALATAVAEAGAEGAAADPLSDASEDAEAPPPGPFDAVLGGSEVLTPSPPTGPPGDTASSSSSEDAEEEEDALASGADEEEGEDGGAGDEEPRGAPSKEGADPPLSEPHPFGRLMLGMPPPRGAEGSHPL